MCECLFVLMCICMWLPVEARRVTGSPEAGVINNLDCQTDVGSRNHTWILCKHSMGSKPLSQFQPLSTHLKWHLCQEVYWILSVTLPHQHSRIPSFVHCPTLDASSGSLTLPVRAIVSSNRGICGIPRPPTTPTLSASLSKYPVVGTQRYAMQPLTRSSHTPVTAISSTKGTHPPVYPWVWLPMGIKANTPSLIILCFLNISISSHFFWHLI